MRQKAFVIVLVGLITGLTMSWYFNSGRRDQPVPGMQSTGIVWPQPRPLAEFHLSDHDGQTFSRDQLQGNWTLMFFGYASCPDICPATMMMLRSVALELEESGEMAPHVVLVTVDPKRDDAKSLAQYVTHFDPDFTGVLGDDEELRTLALQVGAMYDRDTPDEDGNYDVAHSASLFLVDPQARIHAVFSPPHKPTNIAKRLTSIRRQYEQT